MLGGVEDTELEILIISGMSGAGKSRAAICLEDSGYYIVDNLPANLTIISAGRLSTM